MRARGFSYSYCVANPVSEGGVKINTYCVANLPRPRGASGGQCPSYLIGGILTSGGYSSIRSYPEGIIELQLYILNTPAV